MERKVKVSVVVPIYNKESMVARCVESIRNQSYDNIEIILVDDGSTDGSSLIIDQIAEKDERIVVIHQINSGVGAARNVGIQKATGQFVLFVDADDYIDNILIEDVLYESRLKGADCVVFDGYIEDECGNYRVSNSWTQTTEWIAGTKEFLYNFFLYGRGDMGTSVWNKLFSLDVIKNNQLEFSDLKIGEDTMFCIEYGRVSRHWVRIRKSYYHYIQWGDSTMHKDDGLFEQKMIKLMNAYDEFASRNDMQDYLRPAIHCLDISDIFTIMKNYYTMKESVSHRIYKMRSFMESPYCREKIEVIDYKRLTKKYRMVYIILRNRWSFMMFLLTYLYYVIYK